MEVASPQKVELDEFPSLAPQNSWVGALCAYFRDFLDTDFQRARAPKRSITFRDASSNLTGVALAKYPDLAHDLWELLARPFDQTLSLSLSIRRGKYRSRMSRNLNDVIQRHVQSYADDDADKIVSELRIQAREGKKKFEDDPERFANDLADQFRSRMLLAIINPLLGALDAAFMKQASDSFEGIFDLEEELGRQLIAGFADSLSPAIASALVDNDFEDLDKLIKDACSPQLVRGKFLSFFEGFATNDFFNEISELKSTLRLRDNFQIYIYACALRFGSTSYPLFYLPIEVTLENSTFTISADPHLLINKKAIDFAVSEINRSNQTSIPYPIPERIIYISEGSSFLEKIQSELDEFTTALSLKGAIDLHETRAQQINRGEFRVDNSLYSELQELAHLQTQRLANTLDERVVRFADTKRNKAQQIKDIIKQKQMFPKDLFEELRAAFPVMIASIRDYAEYVPLEQGLFDLIIIDEASQVSIAQALPAFIRCNKVVVLGDRNQFSNVKTERASIAINQAYKAKLLEQFRKEATPNISQINQIKTFDIKTSVLDFVERIANLKIMLRKHFRGYPELIGFSSKYFYNNQLQAVKIRGKPIEAVISFREIEDLGEIDLIRNTNVREAEAIIDELKNLADMEPPPSCCVVTPHTEQQKYIFSQVSALPEGRELIDRLNLKVFTFDTCQGEERDTVLYSMVATRSSDRLRYIFPKSIDTAGDVEDNLRLQRLNVGFSRAKESAVFFHSKPLTEFDGSISTALRFFEKTLYSAKAAPTSNDVDPKSPMEARLLNWVQQVPILEELEDQVEVDTQFELGAYLRQLDPTYAHPDYKVDFLIKISGEKSATQIIVEYDGFKEHFTDLSNVNASNYEHYMKPADIERQKVLEGYGYKFLRVNRFNTGEDPVKTLDTRIRQLINNIRKESRPPKLIEEYQTLQGELGRGDAKVCSRCQKVKPTEAFFDKNLKNGKGGLGRVCADCKKLAGEHQNVSQSTLTSEKLEERVYLVCPYSEKEVCKRLGGRWDPFRKKWYVPAGVDPEPFSKWAKGNSV